MKIKMFFIGLLFAITSVCSFGQATLFDNFTWTGDAGFVMVNSVISQEFNIPVAIARVDYDLAVAANDIVSFKIYDQGTTNIGNYTNVPYLKMVSVGSGVSVILYYYSELDQIIIVFSEGNCIAYYKK
jgi:hypothetical protein